MTSISHVITGLDVGGAERALYTLLTNGLEGRFRNRVISLMGPGHYGPLLEEAGIPVTCLYMDQGKPTLGAIRRLLGAVSDSPTDILQGWMLHGNLAASLARRMANRRAALFWNQRTSLDALSDEACVKRGLIRLEATLSRSAQAIIYNSVRSQRQYADYGYRCDRSLHLPNGFDTEKWAPNAVAREASRRELGIPQGAIVIGYVGRGHPQKDIGNLYAAFNLVSRQYPDAVLVAVGRHLSHGAPRSGKIILTGERRDVPALMNCFDLLCLSSRAEGFPNVVGEAMASGLPCVTTDVGDAATIVGDTGWVAHPRNPERLARCLKDALSCSPEHLRNRGLRARERIESHYSIASVVDQYAELYCSVAEECG